MKRHIILPIAVALTSLIAASVVFADESKPSWEVSVLGGIHTLNKNDTALPDHLLSVPVVGIVTRPITRNFAAEGDVTWLVPIKQSVDLGAGLSQDRKAPNILAYQLGVRAGLPLTRSTPYVAAGAGAMTFLSNTDADRLPQLDKSQTVFALNFGGGARVDLNARWGLRADFREFVAFPSNDAEGLSIKGSADPIWMERGALGVAYAF